MQVRDDGTRIVILSAPMLIGKIFAIVFAFLAVLFPLALVISLLRPPRMASIDCERARATCEFRRGTWHQSLRIDALAGAQVLRRPGARNASPSHYVVVRTLDGGTFNLSESSYHDDVTAGYRASVDGFNRFLAAPAQPTFASTFVAGDYDWVVLIMFSLLMPPMAWFFLKAWVRREIEVDRAARTIRVRRTPKIGQSTDETIPFGDVRGLRVTGVRWARIVVDSVGGPVELLVVPRTRGYVPQVRPLMMTLGSLTGIRPEAEGAQHGFWGLD